MSTSTSRPPSSPTNHNRRSPLPATLMLGGNRAKRCETHDATTDADEEGESHRGYRSNETLLHTMGGSRCHEQVSSINTDSSFDRYAAASPSSCVDN